MNKPRYQRLALLFVLLLSPAATPADSGDRTAPNPEREHWVYTSIAENPSARCFDEALWTAISNVAGIEAQLPVNLHTIELEVRCQYHLSEPLRLVFSRRALCWLRDGAVTPERFLQDHVRFI